MKAVVTTGNGGYEKLVYKDVPDPEPGPGEVLVQVLAAGMNNTEINTRVGWYSASVKTGTEDAMSVDDADGERSDGGWNAKTPFPFIQGTDCCGRVIAVGPRAGSGPGAVSRTDPGSASDLIGKRILIRACMRPSGFESMDNVWMGSDFDGAFAQLVKVPAGEVFPVESDWSDAELGTIPCAYGTAENMIHRAGVSEGDHVLVPGASGGVGSATVQLAKRRGARVTAITSGAKVEQVRALGADTVLRRDDDVIDALGEESVDVVVDNVAGTGFPNMLAVLRRGGRYVTSGAIGGPLVELDTRTMYLKDLTLIGCTAWDEPVFPNLVGYIERGEIKPLLAKTFPLEKIAEAQQEFLRKEFVGKFVLIPPQPSE